MCDPIRAGLPLVSGDWAPCLCFGRPRHTPRGAVRPKELRQLPRCRFSHSLHGGLGLCTAFEPCLLRRGCELEVLGFHDRGSMQPACHDRSQVRALGFLERLGGGKAANVFAGDAICPRERAAAVGHLIGAKTVLNEFLAYSQVTTIAQDVHCRRPLLIAVYALRGFASLPAIAIQIGATRVPGERRRITCGVHDRVGGWDAVQSAAIALTSTCRT